MKKYIEVFIALICIVITGITLVSCGFRRESVGALYAYVGDEFGITNYYENISEIIMDLELDAIDYAVLPEFTAKYIYSKNNEYKYVVNPYGAKDFSFTLLETNVELRDKLDNVLTLLRENGTLERLEDIYLSENVTDTILEDMNEATVVGGADTIKVGITGDLMPLDYVTEDGSIAGYSVALFSEISNKINLNFELVQIDEGQKLDALKNGDVDVLMFYLGDVGERDVKIITTKPYHSTSEAYVTKKCDLGKIKEVHNIR